MSEVVRVRFTETEKQALKEIAKERKTNMAQMIRELVKTEIIKEEKDDTEKE